MNILFLDDQNVRHEYIQKIFKSSHNVLHAYNSQDAINILLNYNKKIDIAMLDHDLFDFISEDGNTVDYNFLGKKIERDGVYFLKQIFNFIPKDQFPAEFIIHSHNPTGARNMLSLLRDNNFTASIIPFSTDSVQNLFQRLQKFIAKPVEMIKSYNTPEAITYSRKVLVESNLKKNRHFYDEYLLDFMNKEDINDDAVRRFFDLKLPSNIIELRPRLNNSECSISIHTTLNPSLQDSAMTLLDGLLFNEKNFEWMFSIYPWSTDYEIGISSRSFFGIPKEVNVILYKYIKESQKKFGKALKVSF